jgi:hypothetical protein
VSSTLPSERKTRIFCGLSSAGRSNTVFHVLVFHIRTMHLLSHCGASKGITENNRWFASAFCRNLPPAAARRDPSGLKARAEGGNDGCSRSAINAGSTSDHTRAVASFDPLKRCFGVVEGNAIHIVMCPRARRSKYLSAQTTRVRSQDEAAIKRPSD